MSISSAFKELTGKDWIEGAGMFAAVASALLTIGYYGGTIRQEIAELRVAVLDLKNTGPDVANLKIRVDACCPYYNPKTAAQKVTATAAMAVIGN